MGHTLRAKYARLRSSRSAFNLRCFIRSIISLSSSFSWSTVDAFESALMHIRDLRALADYYRDVMIHCYTIGDNEKTRNAMQVLRYQHNIEFLEKEMHRTSYKNGRNSLGKLSDYGA